MYRAFYLLLILFNFSLAFSQNNSDAGMWNTLSFQKEVNKKIFLTLDQEFRLKENYSRLNLFYTNLGIGYKLTKNLKAELVYRAIEKYTLDNEFSFRHRISVDVTYKRKLGRVSISNRLRYQAEVKDYNTSENGRYAEQFLRHKLELKLDLDKKIVPFISYEARYQVSIPYSKRSEYNNEIHRLRYAAGIDYKINSNNTFSIYYLIQNEFYIKNPEHNYILGLQYSVNL